MKEIRFWKGQKGKAVIILLAATAVLAGAFGVYRLVITAKMSEETQPRESWVTDTGEYIREEEGQDVCIYLDDDQEEIDIYQIIPSEVESEDFTYYDLQVQGRLEETLESLKSEREYTPEEPLAVWNPYGTGSNGLYLYFVTEEGTDVTYRVRAEGADDYEASVNAGDSAEKEFLLIGLVPGMTNEVTITVSDADGNIIQSTSFQIIAPDSISGYQTVLDTKEGESESELTEGLYYTLGTQGYYGYMFFYDNSGVLRYEMLLDGYKGDRILFEDESMICCVSADQIGKISRLGQVTELYTLDGYTMHHDFNRGEDGKLLVLATKNNTFDDRVMDRVLEIDLETGEVSEILDLRDLLKEYYNMTEKVSDTDPFFWQSGTRDWIHLNTVEYTEDDGLLLSSRETSTVIKVGDLHGTPELDYLIGDASFWEGTGYEDLVFEKEGDFTVQYGQHTTTVLDEADAGTGRYYLMMYNNNYYANSTRKDDYEPELDNGVSEELSDEESFSYVYVYLVDENKETYELVWELEVPYSSIVSSVQVCREHLVVNSGVAETFGEYDENGEMIMEYGYESEFQGYRVMKDSFEGFWFRSE